MSIYIKTKDNTKYDLYFTSIEMINPTKFEIDCCGCFRGYLIFSRGTWKLITADLNEESDEMEEYPIVKLTITD